MSCTYYVYILANRSRNLCTGVTNNLERRVAQHRSGLIAGFTKRYRISRLVHYEAFGDIRLVIAREGDQGMAPRKENLADKAREPPLERPRRRLVSQTQIGKSKTIAADPSPPFTHTATGSRDDKPQA